MLFPMLSRACPGRFKCGSATAQPRSGSDAAEMRPNSNPMLLLLRLARPVRLSVFFGLEIGLQWFTNPYKASRPPVPRPPSPHPRGPHKSVAPTEGTVLLPPLLPIPPRVIRRWRETGGCAGRAAAARAFWRGYRRSPADMLSDAYAP